MDIHKKILVIDDSATEQRRLCAALAKASIKLDISLAQDGEEGLQKARREQPDLIFLDILMPGMDGFCVCRELAADEQTKAIPVVLVSIKNQPVDQMWATLQGAAALLGKPYHDEQLLGYVDTYLGTA